MQRGFTLVEILVVASIMAILAAIMIMGFGTYAKRQQFNTEVNGAVRTMNVQQTKSVTRYGGVGHGFVVSTSSITFFADTYTPGATDNLVYPLEYSQATSSLTNGTNMVFFSQISGTSTATGTISLYSDLLGVTTTISIYENGVVK